MGWDFIKAFDSVRWSLIFKTRHWPNFGDRFIDMIKVIFQDIEPCIMNNGTTFELFRPEQGVRQGCCISPLLYMLVLEILAESIRKNSDKIAFTMLR